MQMMTDRQKEVAARALCKARGREPDHMMGHGADPSPDGSVPGVWLQSPVWCRVLREIEDQERLELAMIAGRTADA